MASDNPSSIVAQRQQAGTTVRLLIWLFALSCVLTWAAWHTHWSAARPEIVGYNWRRTVSGWERMPTWRPPSSSNQPAFHPLLLASVQLISALLALSGGIAPQQAASDPRVETAAAD